MNKKISKIIIILLMFIIIVIGLNLIDEVKDHIKKTKTVINLDKEIDTIKLNLNNANIHIKKGKGKIKISKDIKFKKENNILTINSKEEKIDLYIEASNLENLNIKSLNSDIEIDEVNINNLNINSDYLKLEIDELRGSSLNINSSKAYMEIDDLYVDKSFIKSGAGTTKISLENNKLDAHTSLGYIKYKGKKMSSLKLDTGKYYINIEQKLGKIII